MAHYTFNRHFNSPYSPPEVFRQLETHLVDKLGGKVHYNRARQKYVVQAPKRGIGFGPFMNLKILIDLRTDHQGCYIIDIDMERRPSTLFWWSIPVGIILTFMGLPLFWAPLLYFTASPSRDIQNVVDSFIKKMNAPVAGIAEGKREVYQAILIESDGSDLSTAAPEGKVYMGDSIRRILGLSLLLVLFSVLILLIGLSGLTSGSSTGPVAIGLGAFGMAGAGLGLVYVLVKMARDHL
ncbi:MAG: hypothetical protein ACMUHM_03830 [Thermoplasmatota archaeon]